MNDNNLFYDYEVIAQTGVFGFSSLGKGPSINDLGNIAFSGESVLSPDSIYVKFHNKDTLTDITGFDREFGDNVQINNKNIVVATEKTGNSISLVRMWDAFDPVKFDDTIKGNVVDEVSPNFNSILSSPSIGDNNEYVFSALNKNDFTVVTTSQLAADKGDNFDVFQDTLNIGSGGKTVRPMMDKNGNFVMRFLDQDSAITLFDKDLKSTGIARGIDGFSDRGLSPGISDDGNLIAFVANNPNLGGFGIYLAYKDENPDGNNVTINQGTPQERVINYVDGRTISPILLTSSSPVYDIDTEARIAVSSNLEWGRNATVAYLGYKNSTYGLYTTRVNFFGSGKNFEDKNGNGKQDSGEPTIFFDSKDPDFIVAQAPTTVIEVGQSIDGLGKVANISIYDPINSRGRGELTFWVETENGQQAIIKAQEQKVIVLDFNPSSINLSDWLKDLFSASGVQGKSWQGGLKKVFSDYGRNDLTNNFDYIRDQIILTVKQKFIDIGANVKVVNSDNAPPSDDGSVTRVLIGDSPFNNINSLHRDVDENGKIKKGILNGIASSVDFFEQDIFLNTLDDNKDGIVGNKKDTGKFYPLGEDTAFVFADNIFRNVGNSYGSFTNASGNLVNLSDANSIKQEDVINSLANVITHEVGHSLGLSHIDDSKENLIMNKSPDSAIHTKSKKDELRQNQEFSESDINLAEYSSWQQNDQGRLAFNVGVNIDNVLPTTPSDDELKGGGRSNLSFTPALDSNFSSLNVNRAFAGIVPGGEYDSMPVLIDLGSGNLADLLATNIPVGENDQVIFGASTDGNGIDIFGVPDESVEFLEEIDLSSPIGVLATNAIRGDVYNDSGSLASAPLDLYQETNDGFVQIGSLSVTESEPNDDNNNGGNQNNNFRAEDDRFSFDSGSSSYSGNVLSNDSGSNLTVNEVLIQQPSSGSISIQPDGSFTYSLNSTDFIGTDTFIYEVSDDLGNTGTATVNLNISPDVEYPWQVGEVGLLENSKLTTPLADGGFVTVGNQAGTEFMPGGLTGQRYDASGQPVGDSFWIHTWARPGAYTGYAGDVSLASSPDGGFLVVFDDRPTLHKDVYIYDENANLIRYHKSHLSPELLPGYRSGGGIAADSSTALNNGNYVIALDFSYTASPNNPDLGSGFIAIEIYDHNTGELLNSDTGGLLDAETRKIEEKNIIEGTETFPEIRNLEKPKITALSNGGFAIAYTAKQRNLGTGEFEPAIFAQVFDSQGNKVGERKKIVSSLIQGSPPSYSIGSLENGGFVVTYTNYSQGYRLQDDTSLTGNFFEADVIPDNEGVVAQRYDNQGNAVGDLILVKTGASGIEAPFEPDVIGLEDGNFLVTNTSQVTSGSYTFSGQPINEFRGQLFSPDGNKIGNEFIIDEYPGYPRSINSTAHYLEYNRELSVSQLENGDLLVVGKERDNDTETEDYVYTQRLRLNVDEGANGTEVTVQQVGSVSTLAPYAGENPPFDPQPVPKDPSNDAIGNNDSYNPSTGVVDDIIDNQTDEDGNTNIDDLVDDLINNDDNIPVDEIIDIIRNNDDIPQRDELIARLLGEVLDTPFNRFRSKVVAGTYLFANEAESTSIIENFSDAFEFEGRAFNVSSQDGDGLIQYNRFHNKQVQGTYLFANEQESISIIENFSETFELEGTAFYAYGAEANVGIDYYRLRNTQVSGTYLFVNEQEKDSALAQFPDLFVNEGAAFEVG